MKTLILTTLSLISGAAVAEIPYSAWQGDQRAPLRYEVASGDTSQCLALYCTEPKLDRERPAYPVEGTPRESGREARYEIPSKEIADLIKGLDGYDKDDIVVKDPSLPIKPATERDARDAYWKALRQHANGRGTIEQVESAYRELLPYRN